jgi:TrmH family RNA methyltransferase
MNVISSRTNPKIKEIRALRQRKKRQESGLFLVEGIRHVGEAVEAGQRGNSFVVETILWSPDLLRSEFARQIVEEQSTRGVLCIPVSPDIFASIAEKENPQGILAVVRPPTIRLGDLSSENMDWAVALVAPQDPGNLGTILRTADAVGAEGLLLLDSSVDPYHPSSVRASMGAIFWRPVVSATFEEFAAWAGKHGYHIYGTSARGSVDYLSVERYDKPRILLLGSEREGLTAEQAAVCEQFVRLPMLGRATSLNLAVAAGVLLYAMLASDKS